MKPKFQIEVQRPGSDVWEVCDDLVWNERTPVEVLCYFTALSRWIGEPAGRIKAVRLTVLEHGIPHLLDISI